MDQYMAQKNWQSVTIGDGLNGVLPLTGYVDSKNNFYFEDLSRKSEVKGQITIDPKNVEQFHALCKSESSKLYSARWHRTGNTYQAQVRYAPPLPQSSNNPFLDQGYVDDELEIKAEFEPDSLVRKFDYHYRSTINSVVKKLNDQLKTSNSFGEIELDLTNLDDVVCDLATKKLKLSLVRKGRSRHPLIQQQIRTRPEDLKSVYSNLKQELSTATSPDHTVFLAGRTIRRLENQRVIANWGQKKGFEVLSKLMNLEMTQLNNMDSQSLACLADQMQEYKKSMQTHLMNLKFTFTDLEELNPEKGGQQ